MSYQPPMISNPEGENFSHQEHQQPNDPQQQTNYNNAQFYQQQNYNNHQYQEQYDEAPYHEHIEPNDASAQQQQQLLEPAKEANTSQADADASEPHYMKYRKPKGKKVAEKRVDTDKIAAQAEGTIVCCACCVAFCECFVGICACFSFCK